MVDTEKKVLTYLFRIPALDTVYAVRGGIVCKNEEQGLYGDQRKMLESGGSLLVYHPDRTFSLYGQLLKTFARPGESIKTGQAIGLAPPKSRVSITFFFLDRNKFSGGNVQGSPHTHFNPVFHTANAGNLKLEEKTDYVSALPDEVITQDMSCKLAPIGRMLVTKTITKRFPLFYFCS